MSKIEQIEQAIKNAIQRKSKLTAENYQVPGLVSLLGRNLYNNLGSLSTKFLEIENERLKDIVDSGSVGRQAVKEGDSPDRSNPNPPIFYNKETYIDGRI